MAERDTYTVERCPNCNKDWTYLMIENVDADIISYQCKACNYSFSHNKHTRDFKDNVPKFVEEGKRLKKFD
ncbi:MAG: hypothetical protein M1147_00795 [Nitrospirae bacterium]|nr:hypothetical protein [Nitrospirota bacterium]MCL5976649.1 hypothetical protein [Nitrospirota bacterium]